MSIPTASPCGWSHQTPAFGPAAPSRVPGPSCLPPGPQHDYTLLCFTINSSLLHVFVTGANGLVGTAVLSQLLKASHTVSALVRTPQAAEKVTSLYPNGVTIVQGNTQDLALLTGQAQKVEGVIHLAYNHDFLGVDRAVAHQQDMDAIKALAKGLEQNGKSEKVLIIASGTAFSRAIDTAPPGEGGNETKTESDVPDSGDPHSRALEASNLALSLGNGVRGVVIRLSPTVHGPTDKTGFIPMVIAQCRKAGKAGYIGKGENRWNAVHVDDAARLFVAALTVPGGTILHAVGEEQVRWIDIAGAIGEGLEVESGSVDSSYYSWLAGWVGKDLPAGNAQTKELTGWAPREIGLVEDLKTGKYFSH